MGNKNQFTAKQFINAIPGTGGIVSTIAKKVGCSWDTAKKYITTYSTISQAYTNECESVLDMAESKVISMMNKEDGAMLRYYLSTKGKARGYVERKEVEQSGNVTISWDDTDKD